MEFNPVDLFYEEHGVGTPVVFVHGFPFDHSIWMPLVPMLRDHARLILPDLRGFGQSPVTDDVYSMRLMAEDIAHLLDRLEIEKAVVVGHSMGGYISLSFAQAYPGRVLGLGLVATQAAADTPERRQARYKAAESVHHKGARVVASDMVKTLTPRQDLIQSICDLILRTHPTGIVGALKGMAERSDLTGALSSMNVPAVVISGAADQLMPRENVETLAQLLPKGWLIDVPGAGHMLMMEEPQLVAEALLQLINKMSSAETE